MSLLLLAWLAATAGARDGPAPPETPSALLRESRLAAAEMPSVPAAPALTPPQVVCTGKWWPVKRDLVPDWGSYDLGALDIKWTLKQPGHHYKDFSNYQSWEGAGEFKLGEKYRLSLKVAYMGTDRYGPRFRGQKEHIRGLVVDALLLAVEADRQPSLSANEIKGEFQTFEAGGEAPGEVGAIVVLVGREFLDAIFRTGQNPNEARHMQHNSRDYLRERWEPLLRAKLIAEDAVEFVLVSCRAP